MKEYFPESARYTRPGGGLFIWCDLGGNADTLELSKKAIEKKTKIIKDMVHDYITVSKFYLKLIDTEHFQRLRFIRQLTCQYVYPAANHT